MVIGVYAHFLEIVVFAADPQTFLGIGDAGVIGLAVTQEIILELIHPRIGEQQGRVVLDHDGGGGHDGVSFRLKKV